MDIDVLIGILVVLGLLVASGYAFFIVIRDLFFNGSNPENFALLKTYFEICWGMSTLLLSAWIGHSVYHYVYPY